VRVEKEETTPFTPARLDERVLTALQGLPGRVAFSGLRRVLGAHPESLARALRRLEREGLVERTDGGYRALAGLPQSAEDLTRELRPIARIDLPLGTPPDALLGRLSGHWFGSLRWVGVVERPDERLLAWARRDGSGYVLLGIDRGSLRVYVPTDPSTDAAEAEDAAYELLVHAADALRPPHLANATVSFLAAPRADPPTDWGDN
jgi:DNA-binding Lrp family transcriptional regulator